MDEQKAEDRATNALRVGGKQSAPGVDTGSASSGGLLSFFGADSCSSRFFSLSLSFSRFPGFSSLMSRDRFLHRTSISNFRFSCSRKEEEWQQFLVIRNHYSLSDVLEEPPYLEIVLLMELSQNVHDGHGPGVLGSEDHAPQTGLQNFGHKGNHIQELLLSLHVRFQQQRLDFQILPQGEKCISRAER